MAETLKVMASRIQIRRDTDANWTASNPILAQGEIGYDIDSLGTNNSLYKIGDGVSDWVTLPYQSTGGGGGSVDSVTGDGVGGTAEDVVLSFPDTSEVSEGSNLYYTDLRVSNNSSVQANTDKNSYPSSDSAKLSSIEDNAQVNTINSETTLEPIG